MAEAIRIGINRRTLYMLRDNGKIELISRGLYRLSSLPPFSHPDMIAVALRAPQSVFCLISALSFHEITTQIPQAVDIAIQFGMTIPRITFPPTRVHRLRNPCFSAGITENEIDGVKVKVYDVEKTLVDCFKFRNQLGMEVVLEALRLYRIRKPLKVHEIIEYSRICRIEKIIRPYLEATI